MYLHKLMPNVRLMDLIKLDMVPSSSFTNLYDSKIPQYSFNNKQRLTPDWKIPFSWDVAKVIQMRVGGGGGEWRGKNFLAF